MNELFLGILLNVLASVIFLFILLFLLKPKLKISHFICKNDGYQIKLVNKSLFTSYDIKAELCINTKRMEAKRIFSNNYKPINLVVNSIFHIPPYRPSFIRKSTPNAIRLRSHDNLDEILSDENKSVLFMITARHGLSGLTGVFTYEYNYVSEIKKGEFTHGNKIDYIPAKEL